LEGLSVRFFRFVRSGVLHLDASPRGERSISRQLTREFAGVWKQANPGGQIIYRDLGHNPVPLVTETFIAAVYTPVDVRSPELRAAVATAEQVIAELEVGTDYLFGVPMYNFSVPAGFKAYVDQIVIPGRTYTVDESGRKEGLLLGKKATVITCSGWFYGKGSRLAACNYQEPWIRTIFALIGVTSVDFVVADGLAEIDCGKRERELYLRPIRERVQRKPGER
jgi:FMN-dependent NADH-azoreductase